LHKFLLSMAFLYSLLGAAYAQDSEKADVLVADLEAGEAAYQAVCRNCHGPKAQGLASFPKLADKDADYLTGRLKTYRAGESVGPNSMLMIPHAQGLSDQEIANIVGYITTAFQ